MSQPTQSGRVPGSISYPDDKNNRRFKVAADFAYTLNHALVCTATDPLTDVPIAAMTENIMASLRSSGEKVTLGQIRQELRPKAIAEEIKHTFGNRQQLKEWFAGEFAGDFGAVPVVVGIQNFMPWLSSGIRKALSPIASPLFRRSAERTVRGEMELAGMQTDIGGAEYQARVDEIYNREMEHLPNAALWTVASPIINISMQKLVLKKETPVMDMLVGKAIGSTFTSGLTVGMRSVAPDKVQKWDDWVVEKSSGPIASVVAKMSGEKKEDILRGMKERDHHSSEQGDAAHGKSWAARTEESRSPEPRSR